MQVHLAYECEDIDTEVKNKYMLIVTRRDNLNDNIKVEAFEANMNDKNDKNNELPAEQAALIDCSVLKAFIICRIPFQVVENSYFINLLKNLWSNYNPPSREHFSTNLLNEESIWVKIKINNSLENTKNLTLDMNYIF